MRDRPDGAELLRVARESLRTLLEHLPEDRRYTALMIASAMAMAAREMESPEDAGAGESALRELLGPGAETVDPVEALAQALRRGRLDGDRAAYAWLVSETADRLKISNPKRLMDHSKGSG